MNYLLSASNLRLLLFLGILCLSVTPVLSNPVFRTEVFDDKFRGNVIIGGTGGTLCSKTGSNADNLVEPVDVAIAPGGVVYVLDRQCAWVTKGSIFGGGGNDGGTVVASQGVGTTQVTLLSPEGLDFDEASGTLFIADTVNQRIVRYDLQSIGGATSLVQGNGHTPNGELANPSGIVVRDHRFYVSETLNHRLQQFETTTCCADPLHADGMTIFGCSEYIPPGPPPAICTKGFDVDRLREPSRLAISTDGTFYIADTLNHRILRVHVNETRANPVHMFSNYTAASAVVAGTTGVPGCGPEQLRSPTGVAVDSDGYLYVSDTGNHRVLKFAVEHGERVGVTIAGECCCPRLDGMGAPVGGSEVHQLENPEGIAIDETTGFLVVADRGNGRVLAFAERPWAPAASCAFGVECHIRLPNYFRPAAAAQIMIARRNASDNYSSPCGIYGCEVPSWPGFANPQATSSHFMDTFNMGTARGPPTNTSNEVGEYAICMARNPTRPCIKDACRGLDNCTNSSTWICGAAEPFGIKRKVWLGIPGMDFTTMGDLPTFPDNPDFEEQLTEFAAPTNAGDNYAQLVVGLFVPPTTGTYTFHLTSDQTSEVRISSVFNETSGDVVAHILVTDFYWDVAPNVDPKYARARHENDWSSLPMQSGTIDLEDGEVYWVQAIHKEGTGRDFLKVGVTLPNGQVLKPIPKSFFDPVRCTEGQPKGLGVIHNCYGLTTGQKCVAECQGGFVGESQVFHCNGIGRYLGADPICHALNCEEYREEVGTFIMHGITGLLDCTNMGGQDCFSTLGEWAGAGNCVAHVYTPGADCNHFCKIRGRSCVKGSVAKGPCARYQNPNVGVPSDTCAVKLSEQICACGRQEFKGAVCSLPEYCNLGLMSPSGRINGAHEDEDGNLVIGDTWRHLVVRWRWPVFEVVAGANREGINTNQLNQPMGIWFDSAHGASGAVYVADTMNHRVVRWSVGSSNGDVIFGATGQSGEGLSHLRYPTSVYVDGNSTMYVVDFGNSRVLRVLDGLNFGDAVSPAEALALPILPASPADTFFDGMGNYYSIDYAAHRASVCIRKKKCGFTRCKDVDWQAEFGVDCGCSYWTTTCHDAVGVLPGGIVQHTEVQSSHPIEYVY